MPVTLGFSSRKEKKKEIRGSGGPANAKGGGLVEKGRHKTGSALKKRS